MSDSAAEAEELIAQGKALQREARSDEAVSLLERATVAQPDSFDAWFELGFVLNAVYRYEEALTAYERALALRPEHAVSWNNKGAALSGLRRSEEALAALERSLELNPTYTFAWNGRGNALRDLGRYEEALAAFERAIALAPEYTFAWNGRGNALYFLDRFERSPRELRAGARLRPLPREGVAWHGQRAGASRPGRGGARRLRARARPQTGRRGVLERPGCHPPGPWAQLRGVDCPRAKCRARPATDPRVWHTMSTASCSWSAGEDRVGGK